MRFLHRLTRRFVQHLARRSDAPAAPTPTAAEGAVSRPLPDWQGVAVRAGRVQCISPAGLHHMHYLDWGEKDNPNVLVCVHGLTRSGRDFDALARALAATHRVICPDVVGRGGSDWLRDKALYAVPQYVSDMVSLVARLDVARVDWVGTSMGGLIGMALAALDASPIRRLVLNDVGPQLPAQALNRIGRYVGMPQHFATFDAAVAHIQHIHAPFGPHTAAEWAHLTEHSLRPAEGGGFSVHYDPGIGDAFRVAPLLADVRMWPLYEKIRCPVLALRGAESDLLSAETLQGMRQRGPRAEAIEFAGIGHAPTLMHADQIAPIRDFLAAP